MLTFRKKIFASYVLIFIAFIILMSSAASWIVKRVVEQVMENRAHELISRIQNSQDDEMMVRRLKELKPLIFFRVSLINNDKKVLYDSHTKRLLGPRFSQEHVVNHKEVLEAFKTGFGYAEDYSEILLQKFAYTAVAFDFHGKTYVLRTAFPFRYVKELIDDLEIAFFILGTMVLALFSFMTWFIINHFTKPVQELISTVSLYRENERNPLPEMRAILGKLGSEDVGKLAATLVSLSERLATQIGSLREERNEKEVLLESLVEGVIAVDPNIVVSFANESALQLLDLSKEEIIGRSFKEADQIALYQLLQRSQSEQKLIVEPLNIETKDHIFYLDVVAAPKRDNNGVILVMIDKSEHYRILEMRKDFIANASHELKTPITIIRGFAETLHDNHGLNQNLISDITAKIVKNCERMATLVRDLLALADIENVPRRRMQEFDIKDLLEKVLHTLHEVYPEAKLTLNSLSDNPIMEGDYDLIEMTFMNLVTNAIKYSNPPAKVNITVESEKDGLIVKVQDEGIGIPEKDLGKIFERFYRVDKVHSRNVGGSGLGLAIVDTVIKKHMGKIQVSSALGKGSTFTVTLPRKGLDRESRS